MVYPKDINLAQKIPFYDPTAITIHLTTNPFYILLDRNSAHPTTFPGKQR